MKRYLLVIAAILLFYSCKKSPSEQLLNEEPEPAPVSLSEGAQRLLNKLKTVQDSYYVLLGHQATTLAGVGWRQWQRPDFSDFKSVSGKLPAVYGWEIAMRPEEPKETQDYVSYDITIAEAIKAYNRGGLNTFGMHPHRMDNMQGSWSNAAGYVTRILPGGNLHDNYILTLDKYVAELSKLKTAEGKAIPFIFRPYHEPDGNWFWWGSTACSDQEYKKLFNFTVNYMRNKGLNNMVVCYAPQNFQTQDQYLLRYPGDDVVDIIGFDMYLKNSDPNDYIGTTDTEYIKKQLQVVSTIAQQKGKVAAWAETGQKNITSFNASIILADLVNQSEAKIAYMMFWANYTQNEHYVPYDNSAHTAKAAFKVLINREKFLVEGEHQNLYN